MRMISFFYTFTVGVGVMVVLMPAIMTSLGMWDEFVATAHWDRILTDYMGLTYVLLGCAMYFTDRIVRMTKDIEDLQEHIERLGVGKEE